MLKLSGYFTGFSSKADGSASLRFATQELSAEDFKDLKDAHNKFGWILFSENEINDADIPTEQAEDTDKRPSRRLRACLFVLWKQKGEPGGDFEIWYRQAMEKLINKVKANLDD